MRTSGTRKLSGRPPRPTSASSLPTSTAPSAPAPTTPSPRACPQGSMPFWCSTGPAGTSPADRHPAQRQPRPPAILLARVEPGRTRLALPQGALPLPPRLHGYHRHRRRLRKGLERPHSRARKDRIPHKLPIPPKGQNFMRLVSSPAAHPRRGSSPRANEGSSSSRSSVVPR